MVGDLTRLRRGLLAAAVLLLALSGSLAFVLAHDAVGNDPGDLAFAPVGQEASLKGSFSPYLVTPAAADPRWAPVQAVAGNATYVLLGTDPGLVVLVASEAPHHDLAGVIVRGPVALRMQHPDGSGRTLLVVEAATWARPLVFG
ncbi:MAG TPA: hypothetical protein VHI93_06220 [Candidatus Thermoplasmatota archaeon]|nr:hypothetical protein [Candidatus Thermoplasmatota archaeon]